MQNKRRDVCGIVAGLGEKWWAASMECYWYLRNVQDLLAGTTLYERRFGEPKRGPVIPFGAVVEYHISARDKSRLHQVGKKNLPGMFLGYVLTAGSIWKGDILVADREELEMLDASEIPARRLNAKEVLTPSRSEHFYIPSSRWNSKFVWKRSWSPRIHSEA